MRGTAEWTYCELMINPVETTTGRQLTLTRDDEIPTIFGFAAVLRPLVPPPRDDDDEEEEDWTGYGEEFVLGILFNIALAHHLGALVSEPSSSSSSNSHNSSNTEFHTSPMLLKALQLYLLSLQISERDPDVEVPMVHHLAIWNNLSSLYGSCRHRVAAQFYARKVLELTLYCSCGDMTSNFDRFPMADRVRQLFLLNGLQHGDGTSDVGGGGGTGRYHPAAECAHAA